MNFFKISSQRYLQGDHSCGYMRSELHQVEGGVGRDPINPAQLLDMISSAPHKQLIVIDTNIALHQLGKFMYISPCLFSFIICSDIICCRCLAMRLPCDCIYSNSTNRYPRVASSEPSCLSPRASSSQRWRPFVYFLSQRALQ